MFFSGADPMRLPEPPETETSHHHAEYPENKPLGLGQLWLACLGSATLGAVIVVLCLGSYANSLKQSITEMGEQLARLEQAAPTAAAPAAPTAQIQPTTPVAGEPVAAPAAAEPPPPPAQIAAPPPAPPAPIDVPRIQPVGSLVPVTPPAPDNAAAPPPTPPAQAVVPPNPAPDSSAATPPPVAPPAEKPDAASDNKAPGSVGN